METKDDILNVFFTDVLNQMLSKLGLEEIQPNELKDICMYSSYQGTDRPETNLIVNCKDKMISFSFQKQGLKSSNWRHFKR